jgi:hypothetical protein
MQATQAARLRREAALQKLRDNIGGGGPISGAMYDAVAQALAIDLPTDIGEELLAELEVLDGSVRMKRSFAFYFDYKRHTFTKPETPQPSPPPRAEQDRQAERVQLPVEPPVAVKPADETAYVLPQPQTYKLTIRVTPSDSTIKVMNIRPQYHAGMSLKSGQYHILAERQGYQTARRWVTIEDHDVMFDMRLDKVASQTLSKTIDKTERIRPIEKTDYPIGKAVSVMQFIHGYGNPEKRNPRAWFSEGVELQVIGQKGEWLQVETATGTKVWVEREFVTRRR